MNATKDIRTAKFHLAAAGVILSVFYVALILLGGGATVVALESAGLGVDNVNRAFPVLITESLPTEVGIVVILAILSGIPSTTDTRLHSVGVTMARDIYDYFADDPSDERLLKVSRASTIFFGLAATAIAVDPPGTIIELYEWRAILLTSVFLVPAYVSLYTRKTPGKAVLLSIVSGTVLGVGWNYLEGPVGIPATFVGVGAAIVTLGVGYAI